MVLIITALIYAGLDGSALWLDRGVEFGTVTDVKIILSPTANIPHMSGDLRVREGVNPGQVQLSWRIARGTSNKWEEYEADGLHYEYKILRDGAGIWKAVNIENTRLDSPEKVGNIFFRRRKYLVDNLDENGVYSFCVRAVTAIGPSPDEICNFDKVYPVNTETGELPSAVTLSQNYPNPFNPATEIGYTLPVAASVRLEVFDMTGRLAVTLVDGVRTAGTHTERLDASGLPSGTYVYRLTTGSETLTRMLTITK